MCGSTAQNKGGKPEKFNAQGFEVIGVSCDTDKDDLQKYIKREGISWPQYYGWQTTDQKQVWPMVWN